MKILGIDPGSSRMGYGLIHFQGGLHPLIFGVAENKERVSYKKLAHIAAALEEIIVTHRPDCAAIEKLYFSKNQKTAIEVAQARGVILYLLHKHQIPCVELGPNEIKLAVTGHGSADKQAVAFMVKKILRLDTLHKHDDASDALAVAIAIANPVILKSLMR